MERGRWVTPVFPPAAQTKNVSYMNLLRLGLICCLLSGLALGLQAQDSNDGGRISGSLESTGNVFLRDSSIGAANTPQYDRQFFGADAWLNVNYSNWGFDFGLRFDLFNNSNLLNPQGSYTAQGIGRWYIRKNLDKITISGGYLYDQIGSGIIFRAYEERTLAIDNALFGVQVAVNPFADWHFKVFSGLQKQQFGLYNSVISGFSTEGFIAVKEGSKLSLAPGFGVVHRTLDDASMNSLVATINTYLKEDAFVPVNNTYAFSVFNTLSAGPINWYLEGAYKTEDNLNDPFGVRNTISGDTVVGPKFFKSDGSILYTSISYANKGWGLTLEGKRTENFSFRTRPQEELNRGLVNFLPPMTRVNTYRLTARYNAATQELGEYAFQADIRYAPSRKISFNVNFSNLTDLEGDLLYREIFTQMTLKKARKWLLTTGVQFQNYNQEVYEFKPNVPIVETITPYVDFLYRIDRKKSIRFEAQYMQVGKDDKDVRHDYGNWLFGLVEFSIAPHWTFTVSDMLNVAPGKNSRQDLDDPGDTVTSYPRFDVFYNYKSSRFSLSYVKQVEGVVCSGGVCRLEPAFSGVKLSMSSSF